MSLKSKDLQEEFTYNADTQKALSKNGETLSFCLTAFNNALHTLIFKTMEDTVMTRGLKYVEFVPWLGYLDFFASLYVNKYPSIRH